MMGSGAAPTPARVDWRKRKPAHGGQLGRPCCAVVLTLTTVLLVAAGHTAADAECPSAAAFATLAAQLSRGGQLLQPGDAGFANATEQFQTHFHNQPCAAVLPAVATDVAAAVAFATGRRLPLSVKSSGSSYAGLAVLNNSLLLDMAQLNSLQIDPASRQLTAGPAVRLRELVPAAREHGLFCTWGGCPGVALGGYSTGGGEGNAMTLLGPLVDSVLGYEVVLANGSLVEASTTSHPQLFWALRGGHGPGPNFGLVTAIVVQMQVPPPELTQVEIAMVASAAAASSISSAARLADTFFKLAAGGWPGQVSLGLALVASANGTCTVSVSGWVFNSTAVARALLAPLLALPGLSTASLTSSNVWDASSADFDFWGSAPHNRWRAHSGHFAQALPTALSVRLVDYLARLLASLHNGFNGVHFFLAGPGTNAKPSNATAYPGRGVLGNCGIVFATAGDALFPETAAAADEIYAMLASSLTGNVYANLVDLTLSAPLEHYYAGNLPQLLAIKRLYDPTGALAHFPQALPAL